MIYLVRFYQTKSLPKKLKLHLCFRAATIVLRENNCHFLRVDKENFNRILRDVEANTVRLKEHGKDVLRLEKINSNTKQVFSSHYK